MPSETIFGDVSFFAEILKKSGYKSVSFGIAEILDNSIDANAKDILIVGESGSGNKIRSIGFLDNGNGMDIEMLKTCLQVGTRFDVSGRGRQRGKYGFGLPGSSAAHSNLIKVYSWQRHDPEKVYMVSLNVSSLNDGISHPIQVELPEPYVKFKEKNAAITREGQTVFGPVDFYNQGTLVLWEDCERITPKNIQILFRRHIDVDLGRLFRHFITNDEYSRESFNKCNIHTVYNLGAGRDPSVTDIKPNDPLYMMKDHKYSEEFFFDSKAEHNKSFMLNNSEVVVRFSLSSSVVRKKYKGKSKMNTVLGKNLGISIVREGREIDFGSFHFTDPSEDRNRFWGCEILFSKEADDYFGVPANKQHVDQLKQFVEEEGVDEYPEQTLSEELPIWLSLDRNLKIKNILTSFLNVIIGYGKGNGGGPTGSNGGGLSGGSSGGGDISDDPGEDEGGSTSGPTTSPEDSEARQNAINEIRNLGIENPTEDQIKRFVEHRVVLVYVPLGENTGFMDIQIKYGICVLKINNESSFYRHVLKEIMDTNDEAGRGVELLLLAYARCMDLHRNYETFSQFPRVLGKWASKAEDFIKEYYRRE